MATKKKLLEAAAGAAGGAALNVEDVFSTYLYTGNSSTNRDIVNGLDLSNEGGMIWFKTRGQVTDNSIFDTERGGDKRLIVNSTSDQYTSDWITFQDNGFKIRSSVTQVNYNNYTYANWTFRKAPKFFDVVTYTGDGVAGREIAHNLGATPACIIVKSTSNAYNWCVYHSGILASDPNGILVLNSTNASSFYNGQYFFGNDTGNVIQPTDSVFTVGSNAGTNGLGATYVAYLFAHNNGDGDFGPTGDQDIIKCGSYTGNDSYKKITLGFEPQWVLIKAASGTWASSAGWRLIDNMRNGARVYPNSSNAETGSLTDTDATTFEADGFSFNDNQSEINRSSHTYIYIAIRRGPMAVPESATDVFAVDTLGGTSPTPPAFYLGAPVDLQVWRSDVTAANNWEARDRLRGLYGRLKLNLTDAEDSNGGNEFSFDQMLGQGSATGTNTNRYSWMWRRAPSFFDVVAYTGTGSATTINHNLGVAPEMMWIKKRDLAAQWVVYHQGLDATAPEDYFIRFDTSAREDNINRFNDTAPTSSVFTVNNNATVNTSGGKYIAYLFASLDGVSKVGSYTGNGSSNGDSQNIDCGFSSGARFVLIKRTDNTGNWLLFDTKRGIISGNDPALRVNSTGSNFNGYDFLEPNSNGFNVLYQDVSSSYNPNISGASYIFYAIA